MAENTSNSYLTRMWQTIAAITGVITTIALLIFARHIWLIVFAAIVFALMLRGIGSMIAKISSAKLSPSAQSLVAIVALTFTLGTSAYFLGQPFVDQLDSLTQRLPQGVESLEERIMTVSWVRQIRDTISSPSDLPGDVSSIGRDLLSQFTGVISSTIGFLLEFFIILVLGTYLALSPQMYTDGFLRLFPKTQRKRMHDVLNEVGGTVQKWLVARLASMVIVAILTFIGLIILGIPYSLPLAVIAGLLSFIPNLGPILSAMPAIIVGFTVSPETALSIAVLYTIVQTIESYFITPNIQQFTLSLPPVLVVTMQIFAATYLGLLGVFLAAPLLAMIIVIIKELYVEDVLHDETPDMA